jgi:hypothetical protein
MKEKWLNRIALVGFILIVVLWAWWLFRPQPMPFTLRARWKVQDYCDRRYRLFAERRLAGSVGLTSQQGQSDGAVVANSQNPNQPKGVLRQPASPAKGISVLNRTFLLTVAFWRSVTWSRAWARSLSLPSLKVAGCKRSRWAKADWSLLSPSPPMGDWRLSLTTDFGSFGLMTAKRCQLKSKRKVSFFRLTVGGWWLTNGNS